MKTADVDILIVPGWSDSGPDHWQSRWARNLKTARRVEQTDWFNPRRDAWIGRIVEQAASCVRPVVLVGHSLGVISIVHAVEKLGRLPAKPIGAFLVAPADVDNAAGWPMTRGQLFGEGLAANATHDQAGSDGTGFAPVPMKPLPFPSVLVASSTDPYCSAERARVMANAWGSLLIECGDAGHINVDSGHGPWPDGLFAFGAFLQRLQD
jgi:uncharacterized protein